jgi:hypothetical protein
MEEIKISLEMGKEPVPEATSKSKTKQKEG